MSALKSIYFIVNPFSGGGKTKGIGEKIQTYLDHNQFEYTVQFTEAPGHATQLAKAATSSKHSIIVAVGGDGTVNEVAAGLINSDKIMGIIPAGSGNGLAMHLGIGRDIPKAIAVLNNGLPIKIDTCELNGRPYINLAGIGFDALIAYQTANSKTRGFLAYAWQSIRSALVYKAKKYQLLIDGKSFEKEALIIEVANAPMFGYNFTVAPLAKLNDGLLEIVVIRKAWKWRYIMMIPRFLNGTVHKSNLVERYTAKTVSIKLNAPAPVHVDGEGYLLKSDLSFSINPLSLSLIANANYSSPII